MTHLKSLHWHWQLFVGSGFLRAADRSQSDLMGSVYMKPVCCMWGYVFMIRYQWIFYTCISKVKLIDINTWPLSSNQISAAHKGWCVWYSQVLCLPSYWFCCQSPASWACIEHLQWGGQDVLTRRQNKVHQALQLNTKVRGAAVHQKVSWVRLIAAVSSLGCVLAVEDQVSTWRLMWVEN